MTILKTVVISLTTFLLISLAAPVNAVESVIQSKATSTVEADASGKIDLNTADEIALTQLPGIGKSKAQAIIAYRKANGKFASLDQLKEVKGIGQGILNKIQSSVILKQ